MTGKITIENNTPQVTVIDIEGVIGLTETLQFETDDEKIATYEKFKQRVEAIQTPEIVVNIRSSGGNVNDALLIHDALQTTQKTITTRCFGYVASAATIIAQAASENRREMSENALYLIHKSISAGEGNSNNLTQTVELLNKTDERIASIYANRAGKPLEEFIELMNCNHGNGRWLSPKEALEAGLIDTVKPASTIANNALECISLLGLPALPKNHTKNQYTMTIKQHWTAILELLGLNTATELPSDKIEQVEQLRAQILTLEAQNERMLAQATQTKPTEDPSPTEAVVSENARSYSEDIQNFK